MPVFIARSRLSKQRGVDEDIKIRRGGRVSQRRPRGSDSGGPRTDLSIAVRSLRGGTRSGLVEKADHARRQLRDPHDETAIHLMVEVDGELAACARLHLGGIPAQLAAPLDLWRFHGWSPTDFGFISKFMVRRCHRGSTVAARLMRAFFAFASERRARAVFCTTFPDLLPLYERAGMRAYGAQYRDPDLGPHHAMVFLMPTADDSAPSESEPIELTSSAPAGAI
ncbi:MAG TPA: GNAT family N-acetyltransferase [Albitalea sp.]|nr:GNAT family N-acetyltransferase [Albitalea sp.]